MNDAANGLFHSLIAPLQKVHYIPLPSLHNLPEKSKKNLFTNVGIPVHLKPWGLKHLRNDIIAGVKAVYKDIKAANESEDRDNITKDGKRKFQAERGTKPFLQDGKTSFYNSNSSHSQTQNINKAPENPKVFQQHVPNLKEQEWKNTGDFQPSGRDDLDHELRNGGDFQPSGRDGYNEAAKRGNQQQNNQNNVRYRNNESRGGQHQGERHHGGDSFRPADHGFQPDRRQNQREQHFKRRGDNRQNDRRGDDRNADKRGNDRNGDRRQFNNSRDQAFRGQQRGNPGTQRGGGGQQEPQMPDMVKEYLRRALMNI